MALAASSASLPDRMMRAARLNVGLYEEVEADTTATTQALTVVVIVALASGIGRALDASMNQGSAAAAGGPIGGLIGGILSGLIGWAVWSWVIYFVGTKIFGGTATYGEVLRTLGFAESAGVLAILSFLPQPLGQLIGAVSGIWILVASFIATRQALDITNGKTVGTIIVAACAVFLVFLVVGLIVAALTVGLLAGAGAVRP